VGQPPLCGGARSNGIIAQRIVSRRRRRLVLELVNNRHDITRRGDLAAPNDPTGKALLPRGLTVKVELSATGAEW